MRKKKQTIGIHNNINNNNNNYLVQLLFKYNIPIGSLCIL